MFGSVDAALRIMRNTINPLTPRSLERLRLQQLRNLEEMGKKYDGNVKVLFAIAAKGREVFTA